MNKITVVTATRAEFGLLKPLIQKLLAHPGFETQVVVTGAHLSPEFGRTVGEIEEAGIPIARKIEILMSSDTPVGISKSMGLAMISFAEYFDSSVPDALIVLGDRYETLAVCSAAMIARIPIIHLYGGERTEGVIDEAIRHSITKMSILHFTSTAQYRKRVIQMGESPDRVFCVGALGVDNIRSVSLLSREELEKSLGCLLGGCYAVGTFHPVTLERRTAEAQIRSVLQAVAARPEIRFLFTKANADTDGRVINSLLQEYQNRCENLFLVDSLGMRRYLSALNHAYFVIGNSSSGLIEAPSFHIPTIDIGDRQRGRIAGKTVIHCEPETDAILCAIDKAGDPVFRASILNEENPYGDGFASDKIIKEITAVFEKKTMTVDKPFYDLNFEGSDYLLQK